MLLFIYTFSLLFLYLFPINKYIYLLEKEIETITKILMSSTTKPLQTIIRVFVYSDGRNEMDVIVWTRTCTQIN